MTDPATVFDNLQHIHDLTSVGQPSLSNRGVEDAGDLSADWLQSCTDIPQHWLNNPQQVEQLPNNSSSSHSLPHATATTTTTTTNPPSTSSTISPSPSPSSSSSVQQQGSAQLLQQAKAVLEMDPVIEHQRQIRQQLQQLQQQQQLLKEHLRYQANEYLIKKLQNQNEMLNHMYPPPPPPGSQKNLAETFRSTSTSSMDVPLWLMQQQLQQAQPTEAKESASLKAPKMDKFPEEELCDFKHVIYNHLVDAYNEPHKEHFVQPYTKQRGGAIRHGFRFNSRMNPEKRLPELYSVSIRKAKLDLQDQNSVFTQDLYKFYLRASVELLTKYFEKEDKYTYLYDEIPLFVPGGPLDEAAQRIKTMKTRSRKRRKS